MNQTQPKTILMPSNGALTSTRKPFDWQSLLLAITVAITTGSAAILLKLNSDVAVIQDQRVREEKDKDDLRQDMNEIRLDIRDIRDRQIRNERNSH